MHDYIERVVDLTDPGETELLNLTPDEARHRMLSGEPESVRDFDGSFALVAKDGKEVSWPDRSTAPSYFLAKQIEGPALVVAHRIDAIRQWLEEQGFGDQFHPYYTRMVPAHYLPIHSWAVRTPTPPTSVFSIRFATSTPPTRPHRPRLILI
ncbi:MAG: hypothetical protein CM1200mP29_06350 [Verrucomicrobiota bacterium]|nr:MAG: hypothetical protein CM1200mP29_06350 [Verrucomicrobiota bacterium]